MFFSKTSGYLLERNRMKHFDEELNDFLWHCYQLKKKAEAAQKDKKSLPTWLYKLLDDNKPSKN